MKHLSQISISIVPHDTQEYPTVGNYTSMGEGFILIEVSKTKADYEFLIMIHELIEWYLTQKRGISIKKITAFDKRYEKMRKKGDVSEPGDDLQAPYYKEHKFATVIEKLVARELKVDWKLYEKTINSL